MSSNQQQSQRNQVIPEEMEAQKHIHRHRGSVNEQGQADSPIFRDDEAFARYQMGDPNPHRQADEKTQVNTMNQSITQNHHARGGAKEKAKEGPRREEMEDLQPQLREML
ncbi:hypothetical protein CC1G_11449 [Coprinopsis cinerea okayama7|uniref:Uncharacterized protein n=1 Tax=Coprinopsis cinerea (strain Okayama-7 / 130 / ATCC MYA-4618 / FGSC 9003) TaxID=240176 RepID=A8P022_COPC7|nr:hypothetical protein CC1G_11449 [Coprinopsis cinerea okayama7\|eukprot:XP_001837804.1 hypothetical protein CC1G_11449 [Coprinopsis cinerea okayama7\